jgi:predicted ABC-type transport system involved in lysophospholipase L1 biosynthesis ATPase subunit
VLENVLIPTLPLKSEKHEEESEARAKRLLSIVGLDQHLDHFPAQLSGGELQRTAVIRALINQPKLLLADEPTGSLDKQNSDELAQLLTQLNKEEGVTLIVVTHSAALARNMDLVFELNNGILEKT